ncbi:MAG: fatty acid hydroxylase [Fibrobacteres bacterium]|nr:fatty acid hydroxylase [Fibrobacterota bacterium]
MSRWFDTTSETRGWLLEKFAKGTANYWFAFIADFATAMFFISWEISHNKGTPTLTALGFTGGFLIWGLTEYVFHRWVYHQVEGIFGDGHRIHHTEARTLIAMPWFMTTLTMFALWHIGGGVLRTPYFSSVLAGWLVGFVWYSLVHHSHHHWAIGNSWIRRLKAYHRVHHHFPDYNYGVTIRFWDIVFRTQYRKPLSGIQREKDVKEDVEGDAAYPDPKPIRPRVMAGA